MDQQNQGAAPHATIATAKITDGQIGYGQQPARGAKAVTTGKTEQDR